MSGRCRRKGEKTRFGLVYHRTVYSGKNGSVYITLPKEYVKEVGIKDGDQVTMLKVGDKLVISPIKIPFEALEVLGGE